MKSAALSPAFLLRFLAVLLALAGARASSLAAAFHNPYGKLPANATAGDRAFAEYFKRETRLLQEKCLSDVTTLEEWERRKPELRRELFEMLGLDPLPPRTELKATVTGTLEQDDFKVEKLHFQSRPGLYVTADLYIPKNAARPVPAILYVCGHSVAKTNGVSYGNKVDYQRHGIWFARHGYVCLMLDTVQLGEIEGIHHGTYREGMWWWNSRGYTPAGAEAWNCIRALDYLETRPEVDKTRMGVTGRSGGGAYSWWIAALDERIRVACPVAGITDLQNHVVDGTVEGHCDCMFMVNTYRWDYPQVAALVAPRPLLICNSDKDTIFPLDGIMRLHEKVRHIYELYGATSNLGVLITEGPHKDTQELQVPVFRWFNRFLKREEPLISDAAVRLFSGQQLKVFQQLPADEITSKCYEHFTQLANPAQPCDSKQALADLRLKTFGGWPETAEKPMPREVGSAEYEGVRMSVYEFESQPEVNLRFYLAQPVSGAPRSVHVEAVDERHWRDEMELASAGFSPALQAELALIPAAGRAAPPARAVEQLTKWMKYIRDNNAAYVTFAPRGVGLTRSGGDEKYVTQVRRRFMLLGQTLAGMQAWDVLRAGQAVRQLKGMDRLPLHFHATSGMTEITAFAALFEPDVASLTLPRAPASDKEAPDFLNWSRIITPDQLLQLAEAHCKVTLGH